MKAKEVEGFIRLLMEVDITQGMQITELKSEVKALKKAQCNVKYPFNPYDR
jgi:hypothetical protein